MTDRLSLPDFMIIGVSRCGTSSLFKNLCRHADIQAPMKKEIHFFDNNSFYRKGLGWYSSKFPDRLPGRLLFEATPNYFSHQQAPARIKLDLPWMKMILMFRDPVARAWSNYCVFRELFQSPDDLTAINPAVVKGYYIEGMKRWLKQFPMRRFLIIKSEDFFRDPQSWINSSLAFLDLPTNNLGPPVYFDPRAFQKEQYGYLVMPEETKKRLQKIYKSYNQDLYQLIGRDFGWEE